MFGVSRYLRITSIFLLFAFDQTSANEEIKCLSLDPNVTSCTRNPCETGYCIDIKLGKSNCCTESHCPETGLFSLPHRADHINALQWEEKYDDQIWYKKKQMIGGKEDTLTCLIPRSFELNTVATLFDRTSTPRCNVSSDCNNDEFCGTVNNPSFCPETKVCLDKSAENGSSLTFCFKLPEVQNRKFLALRKEIGLPVCKSNEDCMGEMANGTISCEKTHNDIRIMNDQQVEMYQSVCARKLDQFEKPNQLDKLVDSSENNCLVTAVWTSGVSLFVCVLLNIAALWIFIIYFKRRLNKNMPPSIIEGRKKKEANNNELKQNENDIKEQYAIMIKNKKKIETGANNLRIWKKKKQEKEEEEVATKQYLTFDK